MQRAGSRKWFARTQRRIRENRKITITNQHRDISAVARWYVAGIADRQEVFHVGIVKQRAGAAFSKRSRAQRRCKRRWSIHFFRHSRRYLMSQLRNRRQPTTNFGNRRLGVEPGIRNFRS